jgi:predicted nucleic acid-binding protein
MWGAPPHLIDVEVASVLSRFIRRGQIEPERGEQAIDDLGIFPLARYPHHVMLTRMWALRENASAYDAAYLALAELLSAPLVTCDERLAGIPGHTAAVEVI